MLPPLPSLRFMRTRILKEKHSAAGLRSILAADDMEVNGTATLAAPFTIDELLERRYGRTEMSFLVPYMSFSRKGDELTFSISTDIEGVQIEAMLQLMEKNPLLYWAIWEKLSAFRNPFLMTPQDLAESIRIVSNSENSAEEYLLEYGVIEDPDESVESLRAKIDSGALDPSEFGYAMPAHIDEEVGAAPSMTLPSLNLKSNVPTTANAIISACRSPIIKEIAALLDASTETGREAYMRGADDEASCEGGRIWLTFSKSSSQDLLDNIYQNIDQDSSGLTWHVTCSSHNHEAIRLALLEVDRVFQSIKQANDVASAFARYDKIKFKPKIAQITATHTNQSQLVTKQAFLVHGFTQPRTAGKNRSEEAIVTVHQVLDPAKSRSPKMRSRKPAILTAGVILDQREIAKLIAKLQPQPLTLLPPNVLCWAGQTMLVQTPAQKRTLHLDNHGEGGRSLATIHAHQPALLFKISPNACGVWALADDTRPDASTPLLMAPYPNLYVGGGICMGSTKVPKHMTPEKAPEWIDGFFGSGFNVVHHGYLPLKTALPIQQFWRDIDPYEPFPIHLLKSAGQNLGQLISTLNAGR
jgi:PRTRC genetic system protein B